MSLKLLEIKINDLLTLFKERTGNKLELFITLDEKTNSLRGYASHFKTEEEIIHFLDLLHIKGIKAKSLQEHSFIIEAAPSSPPE